jgi:ketosteroid isomerase-like protein
MGADGHSVERAKRQMEAFNRRDAESFLAFLPSDCEWRPFFTGDVEGGVFRGHDGIGAWFAELDELFEDIHAEVLEVRDLEDRVVVLGTLRGRGRGSGALVESPVGIVSDLDDQGLGKRGIAFASHAEALAYAGIDS